MAKRVQNAGCLLKSAEFLRTWKHVSANSKSLNLKALYREPEQLQPHPRLCCSHFSTVGQTQRVVEQPSNDADRNRGQPPSTPSGTQPPPVPLRPDSVHDPAFNKIDLSFENAREAYMSKTNLEVLRCLVVFQLCSVNVLVEKNKQVLQLK
jgi:hypothetical protein